MTDDKPDPILEVVRLASTFHAPAASEPVRIEMNDPTSFFKALAGQRFMPEPEASCALLIMGVPVTANPDIPPGRFEVIHYDGTRTFHLFNQDTAP